MYITKGDFKIYVFLERIEGFTFLGYFASIDLDKIIGVPKDVI